MIIIGGVRISVHEFAGDTVFRPEQPGCLMKEPLFIIRGTDVSSSPFPVCSTFSPGFLCAYTLIQGYTHLQNFLLDHSTHIFLQLSFLFNGRMYHKHLSDDSPYQYISFSLKLLSGPQWLHTSIYLISSLSKDM